MISSPMSSISSLVSRRRRARRSGFGGADRASFCAMLTHTDFDHIGSLEPLLRRNPRIRVITSFLGVGILGLSSTRLPMDRVYLVNPGQTVTVGGRRLTAVKPPL
jgi:mRNA degradation ribonuclease J1/J2